jgi:hypothetical protein
MRVWVPIVKAPAEFAMRVCEAATGLFDVVRAIVLTPMTTAVAPGARLIGVPEMVICRPSTSVWVPMMKLLAEFAVIVSEQPL